MKHILSLGGGVQSSVMLLMSCHEILTPKPLCAIFADPKNERQETYNHIKFLTEYASKFDIPVYTVNNGNIIEDTLNPNKRSPSPPVFLRRIITIEKQRQNIIDAVHHDHPSYTEDDLSDLLSDFDRKVESGKITDIETNDSTIINRQCTLEYKLKPIFKKSVELTGCSAKNPIKIWIGISVDEVQRMKPSQQKRFINRYPLIEKRLGRDSCLEWIKQNGFPVPPRSSCVICPYHNETEWKSLTPEEFEQACQFDEKIREQGLTHPTSDLSDTKGRVYLHRSLKPLRDRPFDTSNPNQLELFDPKDEECEGGCFL